MSIETELVAVIDIGSNAVRLVVYNDLCRAPVNIYAERNICGLGKDLLKTGLLYPKGVEKALDSLERFSGLLDSMKIKNVSVIATAALRDAKDGDKFIEKVKIKFGLNIQIISGEEEARLSTLGVMASHGPISGVVGDFGGGSLELALVDQGKIKKQVTLPLGALRIQSQATGQEQLDYIESYLKTLDLLKQGQGQGFYLLGGAWRTLARAHMFMEEYPIQIMDHYGISGVKLKKFSDKISITSHAELKETAGVEARRVADMPAASLVLSRVLHYLKPRQAFFTATGLREGLLYDQLSSAVKKQDPLLTGCREIAVQTSRFGTEKTLLSLAKWAEPVFIGNAEGQIRILQAACLLSDFGWFEHEDHRAMHAYYRILRMPLYGLDHMTRAKLALASYVRYRGYIRENRTDGITAAAQQILTKAQINRAVTLGLLVRLAYTLTAGSLDLIRYTELKMTDKVLRLTLTGKAASLKGDIIQDSLALLAKRLGRRAIITVG